MLKWTLRILGVLTVLLLLAGFWGYRQYQKFTADGNTAYTSIGAPRDIVFAALTHTDSIPLWIGDEVRLTSNRKGALETGDTLLVEGANSEGTNAEAPNQRSSRPSFNWTVVEVRPGELIAMELRTDSSRSVIAIRRDSLVTVNDSTLIVSTVLSPAFDAARTTVQDSGGGRTSSAIMGAVSKLALSAFRAQAEHELQRLKVHIEQGPPRD